MREQQRYTLEGCNCAAMEELLAPIIHTAIANTQIYKDERATQLNRTKAVSMTISDNASDGATIQILLNEYHGGLLRGELFQ